MDEANRDHMPDTGGIGHLDFNSFIYTPLQNFAVRLATEYASETTGMNIGIGQIRLSFPLNLTIRDVKVITPPDTLLSLESFQVNIRPLPLLKKKSWWMRSTCAA